MDKQQKLRPFTSGMKRHEPSVRRRGVMEAGSIPNFKRFGGRCDRCDLPLSATDLVVGSGRYWTHVACLDEAS